VAHSGIVEPIDWEGLREQCAGDEALVQEVVELYRREWRALLRDVQQAVEAVDLPTVKRFAHRLKGALLSLAAKPAAESAQRLEVAAVAGERAKVPSLLVELERELARVARAVG
jgi:HPt (histidine-containing phosphotransfer) domain-containing protein